MKKLIFVASVFALAACSEPAPAPEAPVETVAPTPEAAMAPDGQPAAGSYDVTYADGSTGQVTMTADGTYSGVQGDVTTTGTVAEVDGKTCFDPAGDDTAAVCWTESEAAADGSWTATNDAGETVTVKRAAAAT